MCTEQASLDQFRTLMATSKFFIYIAAFNSTCVLHYGTWMFFRRSDDEAANGATAAAAAGVTRGRR